MITYALDTNIISYLLRHDPVVSASLRQENSGGNKIIIPPLVYYEVKRGLLEVNSLKHLRSFDDFCMEMSIGEMTLEAYDEASRLYVRLRRLGRTTNDADVLIAAFCIVNNFTLVTNNIKHFEVMDRLELVNWKEN
jgi:predicted nucleic acid-binding protein